MNGLFSRVITLLILFHCATLLSQTNTGSVYCLGGGTSIVDESPSVLDLSGNAWTIECWIFPMYIPDYEGSAVPVLTRVYRKYINQWNYNHVRRYQLNIVDPLAPHLEFNIHYESGTDYYVTLISMSEIEFGTWTHVAIVFDGSKLLLYLNGQPDVEQIHTLPIESPGDDPEFGISYGSSELLVDELRLWNIARTQVEISGTMNTTLTGGETGLIAYWPLDESHFDQSSGNTITSDLSSSEKHLVTWARFVSANAQMSGNHARIANTFSTVTFNPVETGLISDPQTITVENTGNWPLYGRINALEDDIVSSTPIFIDAKSSYDFTVQIVPLVGGNLERNLVIDEGNADNLGVQIPITITAINLQKFDGNDISMWIQRNGSFAFDPMVHGSGLEWPKDSGKHVVYASGIWVGAKVNEQIRTAIASYSSYAFEFGPGRMIAGEPDNPHQDKYRVYKIAKDWELLPAGPDHDSYERDYNDWPSEWGAPWDADQDQPQILGDQTLFVVYNDADEAYHDYGYPLGAEIQQTVYGFNLSGPLQNTVFAKFRLQNKSNDTWENTYFAIWSDPDVGHYMDDLVGYDIERNMGYAYNGTEADLEYGTTPPAVGYDMVRGSLASKAVDAFSFYTAAGQPYSDPDDALEVYNFLSGMTQGGENLYTDPYLGPTPYPLSGDPLNPAGTWVDEEPADRRFLLSTGPFLMEPGDIRSFTIAIIVAQGSSALNSIEELRDASDIVQTFYDTGQNMGGAIQSVVSVELDPGESGTVDDLETSGTTVESTAGDEGATVEVVSYDDAPSGMDQTDGSLIHGVGEYVEIDVQGTVEWPVEIKMYYTAQDLTEAGITEDQLAGVYYYRESDETDQWVLYSNSGEDDHGRGPSTTDVHTENVTIGDITYEGYVSASAYHLTAVRIGSFIDSSMAVDGKHRQLPEGFELSQNYPNPFNSGTTITYTLPGVYSAAMMQVEITVYDVLGQRIETLVSEKQPPGAHSVHWQAMEYPSGIYYYHIVVSSPDSEMINETRKMVLLK